MTQSLDSAVIFTQNLEVQLQHCDMQNHLNNIVYIQWVQDAAIGAYDAQGYSPEMDGENIIWFIRRHEVDYRAPAFVGEKIRLATWVERGTLSTFYRRTEFTRLSDSQLLCQAMTEWCYFDINRNRPAKIPSDIRNTFLPAEAK
jgi:acyl-CoA thioester hydrolase